MVERYLARWAACRNEECGLRETHEQLASVSIAVSSMPPDLMARIFDSLPQHGGGREATSAQWRGTAGACCSP